jgi:hypothetical protein
VRKECSEDLHIVCTGKISCQNQPDIVYDIVYDITSDMIPGIISDI